MAKHFDMEEFVRQTAGNTDIAAQVAALYHRDISEELRGLDEAFGAGDLEGVRRRAHKFKSGFIIMGATALHQQALELEMRSKAGESDLADAIKTFRSDCEGLDEEMCEHFHL